jgi:hypothetical protein
VATSRAQEVTTPAVAHVDIPISSSAYYTGTLGVSDGHIEVGDVTDSTCRLATIQAVTLRLIADRADSCNDPQLYGEDVVPVESVIPRGSNFGEVRLSVRSQTSSSFRLGSVVMRYPNDSGTRPEWTYGGGFLWLYDVGTAGITTGPRLPSEVLRISLSAGKVLATVAVPPLSRIALAADDDGLWFGPSQETGTPYHSAPPALLYLVPAAGTRFRVVQTQSGSGQYVNWIATDARRAWVSITKTVAGGTEVTETFTTPGGKPLSVTDSAMTPRLLDIGEGPPDAAPVLYVSGFGLVGAVSGWLGTVGTNGALAQRIVKLDPTDGKFAVVETVTTAPRGDVQANLAFDGVLYLLEGGGSSVATLYRIRL